VSARHDLPSVLSHLNAGRIPDYAVIAIGLVSALLAALGSLQTLVQAASLTFLFTFATVNAIAFAQRVKLRWISLIGLAGAAIAGAVAIWHMLFSNPMTLLALVLIVLTASLGRPFILRLADKADD